VRETDGAPLEPSATLPTIEYRFLVVQCVKEMLRTWETVYAHCPLQPLTRLVLGQMAVR